VAKVIVVFLASFRPKPFCKFMIKFPDFAIWQAFPNYKPKCEALVWKRRKWQAQPVLFYSCISCQFQRQYTIQFRGESHDL